MKHKQSLKRYLEAVYNRCYRVLGDPDMAWDALQDVFEQYYQVCQQKEIHQPLHYLYRMSTNRCLNMLRKESRTLPLFENVEWGEVDGSKQAEGRLLVDGLVRRYGSDDVGLLIFRHVDQMTYQEIGDVVGMSDRGVKKKLDRLERQIREELREQDRE